MTDFPHFEDEMIEEISRGMRDRMHVLMEEALRELVGDLDQFKPVGILVPRGRDVVGPAGAGAELTWHGDAYVRVEPAAPAPLRTEKGDPRTLAKRFEAALAELEAPIDPRVWATTPPPCEPPPVPQLPALPAPPVLHWYPPVTETYDLPPARWSRPLWAWP